jgi:hypothetical protein
MVSRSIILGITYLIRLTKRPKGSGRTSKSGSVLVSRKAGERFPVEGNMTVRIGKQTDTIDWR